MESQGFDAVPSGMVAKGCQCAAHSSSSMHAEHQIFASIACENVSKYDREGARQGKYRHNDHTEINSQWQEESEKFIGNAGLSAGSVPSGSES